MITYRYITYSLPIHPFNFSTQKIMIKKLIFFVPLFFLVFYLQKKELELSSCGTDEEVPSNPEYDTPGAPRTSPILPKL